MCCCVRLACSCVRLACGCVRLTCDYVRQSKGDGGREGESKGEYGDGGTEQVRRRGWR